MPGNSSNLRPRVLSGMRPTGKLHLGNYVGALQSWVKLQHTHECFFFVADWHALTTGYDDTSRVADSTLEVILDYLAAGLDPEKCTMFVQSHVKQHAELHLLFSMITPLGWLERVPSYKEQQQNMPNKDLHMYGFLGYPVLQAADILLYRPGFVPVGEDQDSHVELTREVARRFHHFYSQEGKPVFPEPQVLLTRSPKLLGTDKRKMSKSYGNSILLSDEAEQVAEKIRNSVTDRPKLTDRGSPDRCPVGNLHQIFSDPKTLAYITQGCTQATIPCVECKELAIKSVNAHLDPIRARRRQLEQQPERLRQIIQQGNEKARQAAEETMVAARAAVGLLDLETLKKHTPELLATEPIGPTDSVNLRLPPEELNGLSDEEKGARIRELWVAFVRKFCSLRDVGHRTYVTQKNRRVGVATSGQHGPNQWRFSIGDRHYDALALICHFSDGSLVPFIIPRNWVRGWDSFVREGKNVRFEVRLVSGQYYLESGLPGGAGQEINDFLGNYRFFEC